MFSGISLTAFSRFLGRGGRTACGDDEETKEEDGNHAEFLLRGHFEARDLGDGEADDCLLDYLMKGLGYGRTEDVAEDVDCGVSIPLNH